MSPLIIKVKVKFMRGYTGSAIIEFPIERIKDLTTDQYRVVTDNDDFDRIEELVLKIEGNSYFSPGRYYGPPESSYPDEGHTEICSITWNGKAFPWELTKHEEERAIDQLTEQVQESCVPDYDYNE